ncbi:MAG: hypothetical protein HY721_28585 [Planctomycetes bacterium]|nr:hypothetical protein [Planctomycetota bacterium]
MQHEAGQPPDASAAYHLWDEICAFGLKVALSTATDAPAEKEEARRRLVRGLERSLAERDAAWERVLRRLGEGGRGR